MNAKETVDKAKTEINNLVALVKTEINNLKAIAATIGEHHKNSANLVESAKVIVTKEVLEKKERIPTVLITLWILFLIIFFSWSMIVVLGIFPFIIYYAVQSIKAAPSG